MAALAWLIARNNASSLNSFLSKCAELAELEQFQIREKFRGTENSRQRCRCGSAWKTKTGLREKKESRWHDDSESALPQKLCPTA